MNFQVLVGLFSIPLAYGLPLEGYYVNGGGGYPNQEFYYNYQLQPRSTYFYPNDINKPEFHPELGMSPQYHDLVYDYVKDFAGTQPPPHANAVQPVMFSHEHSEVQDTAGGTFEDLPEGGVNIKNDKTESTTEVKGGFPDKPGLNNYFLPSDFFSLPNNPKSQFYGYFDAIKTRNVNPMARPTSLPPIGGVISNYVLTRDHKNFQNLAQIFENIKENEANLQHIKRQTEDNSDGVEILAEPSQNNNNNNNRQSDEQKEEESENNGEGEQMDAQPGIAQSKPSAIALAGPGGMAQASPVGTALVGQGGLAVAAPSGTAVAGPAGQGAIPIQIGSEKQKKEVKEKGEEESDSY